MHNGTQVFSGCFNYLLFLLRLNSLLLIFIHVIYILQYYLYFAELDIFRLYKVLGLQYLTTGFAIQRLYFILIRLVSLLFIYYLLFIYFLYVLFIFWRKICLKKNLLSLCKVLGLRYLTIGFAIQRQSIALLYRITLLLGKINYYLFLFLGLPFSAFVFVYGSGFAIFYNWFCNS